MLALLDFSSLFDTIDHSIIGHRLHTDFVHSGDPQGSVLGPILFTMCVKPLSAIIDSHSITYFIFADDIQLQMSAPDKITELLHSMQSCMSDIKSWSIANMLKLNDDKTKLMLVTQKRT